MTPIEMHKKMFPHVSLNFYQMDLLEVEIQDIGAWERTLRFWASNDYRGQSIGRMIDYYKDEKNGKHRQSHKPKSNLGALEQSADYFESKYGPS